MLHYTILSWIRISKHVIYFSAARVNVLLKCLVSLQQQRKSVPDQVPPHLLGNPLAFSMALPGGLFACIQMHPPDTRKHAHVHTHAHIGTHSDTFYIPSSFLTLSFLSSPINHAGRYYYQRGNRTGEIKHPVRGSTQSQDSRPSRSASKSRTFGITKKSGL